MCDSLGPELSRARTEHTALEWNRADLAQSTRGALREGTDRTQGGQSAALAPPTFVKASETET